MKTRMLLKAAFKLRNLGLLVLFTGVSLILGNVSGKILPVDLANTGYLLYVPAIAVYVIFVMQTLLSKSFHEDFNKSEKIRHIQDLNYQCLRLSNEAKRNTNSTYLQKLKKVMEDKDEIVDSFFRGEHSFLKEKIVEQTLSLVVSYLKLLSNFCIRSREISGMDVSDVAGRINSNNRKLSFTRDPVMAEDLKKIIEMDEKVISRLKDERLELDRIAAKLDYMESTVNMFKHQILSSVESEDMLEQLETVVNEAEALDNVLTDRQKSRIRL